MKKYVVSPPNYLLSAESHMQNYQHIYNTYQKFSHLSQKNDKLESHLYIGHIIFLLCITVASIMINMYFSVLIMFVILFMFSKKYNRSLNIWYNSYYQQLIADGQFINVQQQVLNSNFQNSHLAFLDSLIYQAKYSKTNDESKLTHIKKIITICFNEKNPEHIFNQLYEDYSYIQEYFISNSSLLKNSYQTKPYYFIKPLNS